jgi:hypothetical protein
LGQPPHPARVSALEEPLERSLSPQLDLAADQPVGDLEVGGDPSQSQNDRADVPSDSLGIELEAEVRLVETVDAEEIRSKTDLLGGKAGERRSVTASEEGPEKDERVHWSQTLPENGPVRRRISITTVSAISSIEAKPVFQIAS